MLDANILIVEDDPDLRFLLNDLVAGEFKKVLEAPNGKEALSTLKNEKIHAVVSDINMPVMTGLELLREIRKYDMVTPFVIVTAFGDKEKALEALRFGAMDFIDKPYDAEMLIESIGKAAELGLEIERFGIDSLEAKSLLEIQRQEAEEKIEILNSREMKDRFSSAKKPK